jgi:hypothetical protein
MNHHRRKFLKLAGLGAGSLGFLPSLALSAEEPKKAPVAAPHSIMQLGLVTFSLAQDWDIATIIKNCEATQFEGVELRTEHAHKVEVSLSKDARKEVKKV